MFEMTSSMVMPVTSAMVFNTFSVSASSYLCNGVNTAGNEKERM